MKMHKTIELLAQHYDIAVYRIEGIKLPKGVVSVGDVAADPERGDVYVFGHLGDVRTAAFALHEAGHVLNARDFSPVPAKQRKHIREGSDAGAAFRALMLGLEFGVSTALRKHLELDYDEAVQLDEHRFQKAQPLSR